MQQDRHIQTYRVANAIHQANQPSASEREAGYWWSYAMSLIKYFQLSSKEAESLLRPEI